MSEFELSATTGHARVWRMALRHTVVWLLPAAVILLLTPSAAAVTAQSEGGIWAPVL